MEEISELLSRKYYHNTVQDYLIASVIILAGLLLIKVFRKYILTKVMEWTSNTNTRIDDFAVKSMDRYGLPALYFGVIYAGLNYLTLTARMHNVFRIAITVLITFLFLRIISSVILLLLQNHVRKKDRGEEKVKELGGLMLIINVAIWLIGLLFLFDNMGFDVTAAIAGLGIGGIAIALASQNILGDLFNYFVIFFDRPFETGDFITVDDKSGVVDYIGVKSTRIKSLSGEQLVFSNSDLTNSRIHNYKRMERRRVVFKIGVVYQVTHEQLKLIPELIKRIVKEQEMAEFDRAHFQAYGDSSLDFEIVYYMLSSEYNKYMDVQQSINLRIFEEFQKHGIEFAYPTRTLFMVNTEAGVEA